jgi:hypothetical protein
MSSSGRICYQRRKVTVSQVSAGQKVGVKQTDDHIWLVTFMDYDLAYVDVRRVASNRPMVRSVRDCYPCLRNALPACVSRARGPDLLVSGSDDHR